MTDGAVQPGPWAMRVGIAAMAMIAALTLLVGGSAIAVGLSVMCVVLAAGAFMFGSSLALASAVLVSGGAAAASTENVWVLLGVGLSALASFLCLDASRDFHRGSRVDRRVLQAQLNMFAAVTVVAVLSAIVLTVANDVARNAGVLLPIGFGIATAVMLGLTVWVRATSNEDVNEERYRPGFRPGE